MKNLRFFRVIISQKLASDTVPAIYRLQIEGVQIATGAGLGLLLGVMLNNCGLWENHILGLLLGPLWGIALGTLYKKEEH